MTDNNKKTLDTHSSAENVEQHLQELEKADYEALYYSQEQHFSAEEVARVVNEQRLNELLAQSEEFLSSLNSEIKGFEDNSK